jgi:hypothetical protein
MNAVRGLIHACSVRPAKGRQTAGYLRTATLRSLLCVVVGVVPLTLVVSASDAGASPLPTVTSVSQPWGVLAGGATVTVTGTGFTGPAVVNFCASSGTCSAGTNVSVVSTSQITVTSPVGSVGTVDVQVTTPSGTSAPNPPEDQFTYLYADNVNPSASDADPAANGGPPLPGVPTTYTAVVSYSAQTDSPAPTAPPTGYVTFSYPGEVGSLCTTNLSNGASHSTFSCNAIGPSDANEQQVAASYCPVAPQGGVCTVQAGNLFEPNQQSIWSTSTETSVSSSPTYPIANQPVTYTVTVSNTSVQNGSLINVDPSGTVNLTWLNPTTQIPDLFCSPTLTPTGTPGVSSVTCLWPHAFDTGMKTSALQDAYGEVNAQYMPTGPFATSRFNLSPTPPTDCLPAATLLSQIDQLSEVPGHNIFDGGGRCYVTDGIVIQGQAPRAGTDYLSSFSSVNPITVENATLWEPDADASNVAPIIEVEDAQYVKLQNLTLNGSNPTSTYSSSRVAQAGIDSRGVTGLTINDVTTNQTWGDGLTLTGGSQGSGYSSSSCITINGLTVYNYGRQGISPSIVSGCSTGTSVVNNVFNDVDIATGGGEGNAFDFESDLAGIGSGDITIQNSNWVTGGVILENSMTGSDQFNCDYGAGAIYDASGKSPYSVTFNGGSEAVTGKSTGPAQGGIFQKGGQLTLNQVALTYMPMANPTNPPALPAWYVEKGGSLQVIQSSLSYLGNVYNPLSPSNFVPSNDLAAPNQLLQYGSTNPSNYSVTVTPSAPTAYPCAPSVSGIGAASGPAGGGTPVTITGNGFTPTTTVMFCPLSGCTPQNELTVGTPAFVSATQLTVASPAGGQGTYDVVVSNGSVASATGPNDQFIYQRAPVGVASSTVGPASGPVGGGTQVVITGSGFSGATGVSFGGVAGVVQSVSSDGTSMTVTSPPSAGNAAGVVDVTVSDSTGTSATGGNDAFFYDAPPTETAVTPQGGPTSSGTQVTITGTGLDDVTGVSFGSGNPGTVVGHSDTSIQVTPPPGSPSTVPLVLTYPSGSGSTSYSTPDLYSYDGTPTVTSVSGVTTGGTTEQDSGLAPGDASTFGDTPVTITGTGFSDATALKFGSSTASVGFTVDSDTQITALAPPEPAGSTVVTVSYGMSSGSGTITYMAPTFPLPAITSVSPTNGTELGGTNITILEPVKVSTALDFADVTGVNLCTTTAPVTCTPAASFQIGSNNSLSAVTPPLPGGLHGQSSETMDVEVTSLTGTSVANPAVDSFQYNETPVVTSVTTPLLPGEPAAGPANCASPCSTSVTIMGSGFTGVSAAIAAGTGGVFFGSVSSPDEASGVTVVSDSEITAVAPDQSAGQAHVKVENSVNGVSLVSQRSQADLFTYDNPPTITTISPTSGNGPTTVTSHGNPISEPGTTVTLKGTGFSDVTQVAFCQTTCIPASSFNVVNDGVLTAEVPSVSGAGLAYVQLSYAASATCGSTADPCGTLAGFRFEPLPVVTGVSTCTLSTGCGCAPGNGPPGGSVAGGDTVVIQGVNFDDGLGDEVVTIGGSAATGVDVCSSTEIIATTAPGSAGDAEVQVSTFAGQVTSPPNPPATSYYYDYLPTVSSVSPNGGLSAGGTVVDITGTGFADATGVFFCTTSVPANCAAASTITASGAAPDTSLQATAPAGTGVADVEVTNEDGTSTTSAADQFTYGPVVASVTSGVASVASGPIGGGTLVTIVGTGFTGATAVSFCPVSSCTGLNAASGNIQSVNSNGTQISVSSPPGAAGGEDVTVTTPDGTSVIGGQDEFTYDAAPTVASAITPPGTLAAGAEGSTTETQVTIGGTGLADTTGVSFCTSSGCTPAAAFTVNSDSSITATSPPLANGLIGTDVTDDIEVINPTGTSPTNLSDRFFYDTVPVVTSVTPAAGPAGGATTVTVYGSGFGDATGVQFAQPTGNTTIPRSQFTVVSDGQIAVPAPLVLVGNFNVKVVNPNGTSAPGSQDRYIFDNAPTVTSVSPSGGLPVGGTSVTITGTGLADVTGVSLGGVQAPISNSSDTTITVTTPAGALGPVPVVLTYPTSSGTTGSFTVANGFTYANTATVTGVSPSSGSSIGGMTVVVTGTGFSYASVVVFGSTNAPSFTVNSDTTMTVTVPPGSVGTVNIRVTNPIGISKSSRFGQFTYT